MIIVAMNCVTLRKCFRINQTSMSTYFMISSVFICLTLTLTLTSGDSSKSKSTNNTVGYNLDHQKSIRQVIVGRIGKNDQNNNHLNNSSKLNTQKEINLESGRVDSDQREWSLQFDPNYFASLNAANHRPIDLMSASPTDSKSKVSASSSSTSDNMYYYSPETYGKTTHKNHKTGSFTYSYPSSSSTTTTTTSTTPTPKASNNRYGEYSTGTASNGYSEPAPQPFSSAYNPTDDKNEKHQTMNFNYDEPSEVDEEPNYYDGSEEIGRKYYYPLRNKHKQYTLHDYYGTDLSSLPTSNDNSKIQSAINTPIADYSPHEEAHEYESNIDSSYGSMSNVKFPSKYYGGTGAYYPSYYPSPYYPSSSEHGYSGAEALSSSKSSSWLGPGIAGLLLGIGLPLGILMASMVPAFMTVPIVSTATVGRKKRQTQNSDKLNVGNAELFLNPILNIISRYGMSSLEDSNCLQEMFCTFTVEGKQKNSNILQNLFYKITEWTPVQWAKSIGMDTLLMAVKNDKCITTYKCKQRKEKSYTRLR